MTNLKITFDCTIEKRSKKTTATGKVMYSLVAIVERGKFAETFDVRFRENQVDMVKTVPVGSRATIEAFVGGREWTNPKGQVCYFTDINLYTIKPLAATPAPAPAAESTPAAQDAAEEEEEFPF